MPDAGGNRGNGRTEARDILLSNPQLTPVYEALAARIAQELDQEQARKLPRRDLAFRISDCLEAVLESEPTLPGLMEQRNLVTLGIEDLLAGNLESLRPLPVRAVPQDARAMPVDPISQPNSGESLPPPPPSPPSGQADAARTSGTSSDAAETPSTTVVADRSAAAEAALMEGAGTAASAAPHSEPVLRDADGFAETRLRIQAIVMERIDAAVASSLDRDGLTRALEPLVAEILGEIRLPLNQAERRQLIATMVDDMLGLGPLEPLLADDKVTDIMVNGPFQVFVERGGKLTLSDVHFRDNAHVMHVATRIVSRIGRRVDESSPICDARLPDGSRVNIIIPPLAIDGASISIRKFSKKKITLDRMVDGASLSADMATVLKIAARSKLNIVISGGTGSGKTTMLNALSRLIDGGDRVVTIEDAAELQLQQPHVVRLETRPPNLEGKGSIEMRDLVKNSLRMRPDRIILGEVRGGEALDMLQAMNTGHEGSMCTLHANKPREALTRIENMVLMGSVNLPQKVIRTQIASAVDLIVQVSRMRDGRRRVTYVSEVIGMEGEVVVLQDLYTYKYEGEDENGVLIGRFESSGVRPAFTPKASYFGLERALLAAL